MSSDPQHAAGSVEAPSGAAGPASAESTDALAAAGGVATRAPEGANEPFPEPPACGTGAPSPALDRSRIIRHSGAGWDGVRVLPYKADDGSFAGITRRILAAPADAGFEVRYFEIDPDGHSSFERHAHVHVVVCHRGRGRVRLGDEVHEVGYGDVVYVGPNEPHEFLNPYSEPFGFLCIVDRDRDRGVPTGG